VADGEHLPFLDNSFDFVFAHGVVQYTANPRQLVAEVHRVLKPTGTLALVDNVVPAGSVGDYINAFERLRDPSHLRAWTMDEWRKALGAAKLSIEHEEQIYKTMEFKSWAQRYDDTMKALLRAMLTQVTPEVKEVLEPNDGADDFTFRLCEGLFIARKK
jgi:SAM-dependent methyltransferase